MKIGNYTFKKWQLIVGIVLVLGFIGMFIDNGNEKTKTNDTQNVAIELTDEQIVSNIINDTVGLKTNLTAYPNTIQLIKFDKKEDRATVILELIAKNNLTSNYIKLGTFINTKKIMSKLVEKYSNLSYVDVKWFFPLTDVNGNEKLYNIVELAYEEETINKTNWKNMIDENIPVIADFKFIHSALN